MATTEPVASVFASNGHWLAVSDTHAESETGSVWNFSDRQVALDAVRLDRYWYLLAREVQGSRVLWKLGDDVSLVQVIEHPVTHLLTYGGGLGLVAGDCLFELLVRRPAWRCRPGGDDGRSTLVESSDRELTRFRWVGRRQPRLTRRDVPSGKTSTVIAGSRAWTDTWHNSVIHYQHGRLWMLGNEDSRRIVSIDFVRYRNFQHLGSTVWERHLVDSIAAGDGVLILMDDGDVVQFREENDQLVQGIVASLPLPAEPVEDSDQHRLAWAGSDVVLVAWEGELHRLSISVE